MTQAKDYTVTVTANGSIRLPVQGTYFKIVTCTGTLQVQTESANLSGLQAGDGLSAAPFTFITITDRSGAANTVRLVISDSEFINSPTVNTAITANKNPISASFANTAKTVTTTSGQLIAGNLVRQYLMIQNRDVTGTLYIKFGSSAATLADGLKISPGGFWEWDTAQSSQAVQAIGDIASNANILVIEG